MKAISDKVKKSQAGIVHINPIALTKNDNVNMRPFLEVVDIEVDEQSSSKRTKTTAKDKVIVDLEVEESINQGGHAIIVQEEEQEQSVTNIEEMISQYVYECQQSQSTLEI